MSGAIFLLPLYAFMTWTEKILPFYVFLVQLNVTITLLACRTVLKYPLFMFLLLLLTACSILEESDPGRRSPVLTC